MLVEVTLNIKTCGCGMVYAIPNYVNFHSCPKCSERKIDELNRDKTNMAKEIAHLERRISRFRGAVEKIKRNGALLPSWMKAGD